MVPWVRKPIEPASLPALQSLLAFIIQGAVFAVKIRKKIGRNSPCPEGSHSHLSKVICMQMRPIQARLRQRPFGTENSAFLKIKYLLLLAGSISDGPGGPGGEAL